MVGHRLLHIHGRAIGFVASPVAEMIILLHIIVVLLYLAA